MRLLYLLGFLICFLQANAQFTQNGKTLEYNGRNKKTLYKSPVSIAFQGCYDTSNDKNGNLSLVFPTAKAGNVVSCTKVEIGNPEYIIFNRNDFDIWTLGERNLPVVLCRKSKIDQYISIYTKVQMNASRAKYNAKVKELKELKEHSVNLEKELSSLKSEFEAEIKEIKEDALIFAYIDEERLDSLEYEQHQCILNNDIEGAVRIGKQIDFEDNISKRLSNFENSINKTQEMGLKLYKEAEALYLHLRNCEQVDVGKDSLKIYYEYLIKSYRTLIEQYPNNFKCTDSIYQKTKLKLGNIIYDYADKYYFVSFFVRKDDNNHDVYEYMKEAASYKNSSAILWMVYQGKNHEECKSYAKLLLDGVKSGTLSCPEDYSFYDIKDICTSIPDFKIEDKSMVYHYTYLNDHEVSLIHAHCKDSTITEINIPKKIEYNGKRFTITEIGTCAFAPESYADVLMAGKYFIDENDWWNNYNIDSPIKLSIPNSITYVGAGAFDARLTTSFFIKKIPEKLKVLRNLSFSCCRFKSKNLIVPEGVERIEIRALPLFNDNDVNDIYNLSLPYSLRELETLDFFSDRDDLAKITDINNNPNFRFIDGTLYNADSSHVYLRTFGFYNKRLNITKNLKFDNDIFEGICYFHSDIDSIIFDDRNPYYSYHDDCLYNKQQDTLLYVLPTAKRVRLSPNLKYACFIGGVARIYEIPDDMTVEGLCLCFEDFSRDDSYLELYGKKYRLDEDILKLLDSIVRDNKGHAKLLYACGLKYLENGYICQAYDVLSLLYDNKDDEAGKYYQLLSDSYSAYQEKIDTLFEKYEIELGKYKEHSDHEKLAKALLDIRDYVNHIAKYNPTEESLNYALNFNWTLGAQVSFSDFYQSCVCLEVAIPYAEKLLEMFGVSKYGNLISDFYTSLAYVCRCDELNKEKALQYVQKALELNPNNTKAAEILNELKN